MIRHPGWRRACLRATADGYRGPTENQIVTSATTRSTPETVATVACYSTPSTSNRSGPDRVWCAGHQIAWSGTLNERDGVGECSCVDAPQYPHRTTRASPAGLSGVPQEEQRRAPGMGGECTAEPRLLHILERSRCTRFHSTTATVYRPKPQTPQQQPERTSRYAFAAIRALNQRARIRATMNIYAERYARRVLMPRR